MRTFQQFLEAMDFDLTLGHGPAVDDAIERNAVPELLDGIARKIDDFGTQMALRSPPGTLQHAVSSLLRIARLFQTMAGVARQPRPSMITYGNCYDDARVEFIMWENRISPIVMRHTAEEAPLVEFARDIYRYIANALKAAGAIGKHLRAQLPR